MAKKPRVLVVDDDNLMRTLLKGILRNEEYLVAGETKSGEHAIELCDLHQPDLVCLDIQMPGMDGLETLKAMRARFPQIHVVMITASAKTATVREALQLGASGYIIKPFTAKRVAVALKAAMDTPLTVHPDKPAPKQD